MAHKELWLLRHGDSEPGDGDDAARRLTDRGEHQARDAGLALAALGLHFVAALTSPRVRAHDTARLACGPLGIEPVEHGPLSQGFDSDDALSVMAGHEAGAVVLVVGHEPDLSEVVFDLTGARIDLKKGGVAGLRLEGARSELVALLRPQELSALAAFGATA
jgi:phosphohistidine phosphatase